jgi:6,7-dimethyl-8-ribityllumazine synthase
MTHILIVSARFYPDIAAALEKSAVKLLYDHKVTHEIIEVPGAFEIPAAIGFALNNEKYDGFVALGCVIRGETTHYDYVCSESARGLMGLSIQHNAAIGNGILTVENEAQAKARLDKGADAAQACLRMIELKRRFDAV